MERVGKTLKSLVFYGIPLLWIVMVLWSRFMVHSLQNKVSEAQVEKTLKYLPQIQEDLKSLNTVRVFQNDSWLKNAEPYLSRYVNWIEDSEPEAKNDNGNESALRRIFAKYPKWWENDQDLNGILKDPDLGKIDLNWVSGIREFDYLDLNTNERISKRLAWVPALSSIQRVQVHATLPLLDMTYFMNQVTAYSIKRSAGTEEDKKEALAILHHAANLLHSSPNLVSQMSAVSMLRRELMLSKKLNIPTSPDLNHEVLNRMKRVAFAWPAVLALAEAGKLSTELQQYISSNNMVCGAAGETPFLVMLSDFFESSWPLESDFNDALRASREIYGRVYRACHNEPYLVFLEHEQNRALAGDAPLPVAGTSFWSPYSNFLHRFPYVRRMVGMVILSLGYPNFVRYYEEGVPSGQGQ